MGKTVPLEVIQNCEFEMLKYVKQVCDSHGLRYYLAYGTLLGAVRHQGFIPWDDDTDVHMPREDYVKFVEILQKEPHPYYQLIARETTPEYTALWPKLIDTRTKLTQYGDYIERVQIGIFLDIFILDGAGNTREEAEARYKKAFLYYREVKRAALKMFSPWEGKFKSFLRWIHHIPEKIMGTGFWIDRHIAFCGEMPYDDYEYVGAMGASTINPTRNVWKREWFGDGTEVTFMGEHFRAPSNWDAVLRPEYGDYMQLPPPEKRNSNHRFELEILDPELREAIETKGGSQ